jgi:beta-lactamase regulating signal transducer with metallopeptidase domain
MFYYWLGNFTISILTLISIYILRNSPSRIKFYMTTGAMLSWCLPWHLLEKVQLGDSVSLSYVFPVTETIQSINSNVVNYVNNEASYVNFEWVLAAIATGILFITLDICHQTYHLIKLKRSSQPVIVPEYPNIRVLSSAQISSAFLTGFFRPTIWVNQSLVRSTHIKTIMTHELAHFSQHDHIWMVLIRIARNFLFWNPIAWILNHHAKRLLEMSCDEKCLTLMDKNHYLHSLSSIILANRGNHTLAFSQMSSPIKNFNVVRLIYLKKEKFMNKTTVLTIATLLSVCGALVSLPVISNTNTSEKEGDNTLITFVSMIGMIGGYTNYYIHPDYKNEKLLIEGKFTPTDKVEMTQLFNQNNIGIKFIDNAIYVAPDAYLANVKSWQANSISDAKDKRDFKLGLTLTKENQAFDNSKLVVRTDSRAGIELGDFDIFISPKRTTKMVVMDVEIRKNELVIASAKLASGMSKSSEMRFEIEGSRYSLVVTPEAMILDENNYLSFSNAE